MIPYTQIIHKSVQPFSRSAVQPFSRSAVQPFSRSAVQPFSRSAVQPFSRSAVQPKLCLNSVKSQYTHSLKFLFLCFKSSSYDGLFSCPKFVQSLSKKAVQND
ncbi:hypothetical protein [Faucicola boevrei]|uniref:hypothetical protein n=1 Tax=Faucicola boevrei TaxID=346665 RepID=UPI0003A30DF5|nr:hypothetical protein [Moraxella boevrei]